MKKIVGLIFLLLLASACAPVISRTTMNTVDQNISFTALQMNPDSIKGKVVLLGGRIIATTPKADGTEIEVLEKRLDWQQRPSDADQSAGRFLVLFPGFLDPAIFESGRKLTVAGKVEGKALRPLSETDYSYPVISAREYYLWKPGNGSGGPRFSIGIGISAGGRF